VNTGAIKACISLSSVRRKSSKCLGTVGCVDERCSYPEVPNVHANCTAVGNTTVVHH